MSRYGVKQGESSSSRMLGIVVLSVAGLAILAVVLAFVFG